jgi:hypothetical protein
MVIHESKYRVSWSVTDNPENVLSRGYGYKQMSDSWIRINAIKLQKTDLDLAQRILDSLDNQECEKTLSVVTEDGYMFLYRYVDNAWKLVQ